MFLFFFFKQKTAYEMRISDWSSDVCSSDLFLKAQQTSRSALIELSRWVASPVTEVAGDIPPLESHVAALTQEELNQVQPELLAAERDIYVADADTSVASSNRTPNWTWGVTYQQRGSQYSNMVSVGVSIPLPISRAKDRKSTRLNSSH